MTFPISRFSHSCRVALVAGGMLLATGSAMAAEGDRQAGASTTIAQERQNCMDGKTNQDRETCLREAGAAKQESQRGNLRDTGDYSSNASKRCATLPADQKADCERRSMGEGSVSGSVGSGGVVRELVTPVPAAK
ncbi:hypothetical protein [Noviherbaspirillum suwonense]|jgi:hypothetical protein|uniref:Uncharacterized protein n=1 Tax=Noviherbaspirillum suwonense TaxID=1224511 RepID=A0ABY1Q456_9BURK|nr:hypothetical protein [Noviherbaspirillum suwonense]SMP54920.1 hypothetical protein SAMN06295970_104101 [Noviherbaspirillum suwonense]